LHSGVAPVVAEGDGFAFAWASVVYWHSVIARNKFLFVNH
jgi:hypothetical protein